MFNDCITKLDLNDILPNESAFIYNMRIIEVRNGVFDNIWSIADTDSCGDPDCGCDGDCEPE